MKKLISLIIIAVISFTLFACDKSSEPSEEIQDPATAPFLDLDAYNALKEEDLDQAEKEYDGKVYRYTGTVCEIGDDYCILGYEEFDPLFDMYTCYYELKVFLENEDLEKLKLDTTYTFAGTFKSSRSVPMFKDAVLITE